MQIKDRLEFSQTLRALLLAAPLAALAACGTVAPEKPPASTSGPAKPPGAQATSPKPDRSVEASGVAVLFACNMTVSNPPPTDADRRIIGATKRVSIKGVALRLAPVSEGCLSSGFGPRGLKQHRGVDYFGRRGDVLAAGDGVIKECAVRADFGNMVLIEHPGGVYTRYAHLASFARAFAVGETIKDGAVLGPIGATGMAGAPHLHYEILSGSYVPGVGSFGLSHHDPFALPARK